jgi:cation:H+ antiporter
MSFGEMPIWVLVAVFAAATTAVWFAGTRLARLVAAISAKTGMGQAAAGMILLASITSSPELAVSTAATLRGTPMLSLSDVLGSTAVNLVILAIADACYGRDSVTTRVPSLNVVLQGVLGIVVFALTAVGTYATEAAWLGVGVGSWLIVLAYGAGVTLLVRSRADEHWKPTSGPKREEEPEGDERSLSRLVTLTVAAGLVILVAGFFLASAGEALAERSGLGQSFFGAVILSLATSTPEISTVLESVRLRRYTMAISEIFGTNLFNVTIIFYIDALHRRGPVLLEAGPFGATAALLGLVLTAIYVVGMIERRDRTLGRMGYDSVAVVFVYLAGLSLLYAQR